MVTQLQGSEFLLNPALNVESAKAAVINSCKQHFRPEFLNRLDELVIFSALGKAELREVARLMSTELAQRLAERNVTMQVTDSALDFAVAQSYDHLYGARPLRRWLVSFLRLFRGLRALISLSEGSCRGGFHGPACHQQQYTTQFLTQST